MAVETITMEVTVPETTENNKKDATKWLHKTKLCVYLVQGSCRLGSKCSFAHSVGEVQDAPNLHKTQLCEAFEKGSCTNEYCTFAHGEDELRLSPNFKNKICKWFGKGKCRNGNECGFAHGNDELRSQQAAQKEASIAPPPGLSAPPPGLSAPPPPPGLSAAPPGLSLGLSLAEQIPEKEEKVVISLAGSLGDAPPQASVEEQVAGMQESIAALQWKMQEMALRSQVSGMKQYLGQLSQQCAMLESALAPPEPDEYTWKEVSFQPMKAPTKLKSSAALFQPLKSSAAPFQPMARSFNAEAPAFVPSQKCNKLQNAKVQMVASFSEGNDSSDDSTSIGSGAEAGGFSSD